MPVPGHFRLPRTPAQYLQVRVGSYSLSREAFQVDREARTSNTTVLFVGVCLTAGSLRDAFRESTSTSSTILKLPRRFYHLMTSVPIGAAGTSAPRDGSEEQLEVQGALCGITGSTLLKRTRWAIAAPAPTPRGCTLPLSQAYIQTIWSYSE